MCQINQITECVHSDLPLYLSCTLEHMERNNGQNTNSALGLCCRCCRSFQQFVSHTEVSTSVMPAVRCSPSLQPFPSSSPSSFSSSVFLLLFSCRSLPAAGPEPRQSSPPQEPHRHTPRESDTCRHTPSVRHTPWQQRQKMARGKEKTTPLPNSDYRERRRRCCDTSGSLCMRETQQRVHELCDQRGCL